MQVGVDLTVEEANKAASYVALNLLATIKQEIGELDNIKQVGRPPQIAPYPSSQIVKLVGFVNCTDDFTQQPAVSHLHRHTWFVQVRCQPRSSTAALTCLGRCWVIEVFIPGEREHSGAAVLTLWGQLGSWHKLAAAWYPS